MLPYIQIGGFSLGTFGLLMWLAFLAAFLLWRQDLRRRNLDADPHLMVGVIAVAGIIGAKFWHVMERPEVFFAAPVDALFSREGFAFYGGLIAGVLAFFYFAYYYKVNVLRLMDSATPAAALGYAVGRIGCLISGDGDYGTPTPLPWGMSFPNGLVPTLERVHPTPIYEFIANAAIAWFLWRRGSKQLLPGQLVAEFFILTGLARFLVEFIRINPPILLGMSNAQLMALISMIGGVALWIRRRRMAAAVITQT
jgi:phosphatidylglycerol---prolipoprotein diacylglyceryl transferase